MDIKSLINKVIASKGILRVPSWWMKKLLTEIVGYIDSGDSANAKSIDKAKNEGARKITNLESEIKFDLLNLKKSLHTQKCIVVKTGSGTGYVVVDGVSQNIPTNTQKIVTYVDTFSFYNKNTTNRGLTFIGLAVADSSAFTDMSYMFYYCEGLTSLDLTGLDTSSVTGMRAMFSYCSSLISLDLRGFDTSAVTNMSRTFANCRVLTSLDLSSFDTSAVTNMSAMFNYCRALTSLDLSSFDTSSVTDMSDMFNYCDGLISLDLGPNFFKTSAVTNMSRTFANCRALTSLDLTGLDTSSVTGMRAMFFDCPSLTSLDLTGLDTSAVTNMSDMFSYCSSLTSLDLSSFDTSAVTNMSNMFFECNALTSLDLGPNCFKTSKVTSIDFTPLFKWKNDTVITSLVTNSYDRASAGLNSLTLKLHANTKAALSDEQKAAITSKGYTIA